MDSFYTMKPISIDVKMQVTVSSFHKSRSHGHWSSGGAKKKNSGVPLKLWFNYIFDSLSFSKL